MFQYPSVISFDYDPPLHPYLCAAQVMIGQSLDSPVEIRSSYPKNRRLGVDVGTANMLNFLPGNVSGSRHLSPSIFHPLSALPLF